MLKSVYDTDGDGIVDSAEKLSTSAGSATQPVYFSNGVPVATTYTLGKSVPSNAVFTDTVYTLPAAGSALGGVKSGGDVTISSGVITVKDDSHNHTIANVDNLQTTLDGKANKAAGIFYIEGTGDTAGTWLGTHSDITEYYAGLMIAYKVNIAGASGLTLNINSLGAVSVVRNTTSAVTTHYGVGSVVFLVYTVDSDGTAYWKVSDYDSDTKTRSSNKTGTKMYLIGAASQSTSGQTTYSNKNCYIGTDNCLYSGGAKVSTTDTNTTYTLTKSGSTITLTGSDGSTTSVADSDTNTTYSTATSSTAGLVKIGYTESGKNYPVELNSSGQMYVNVPWTDNNTVYTHPTYTAKSSGLYKVTVDGTGHVSAATAVTKSDITALGIPAQDTTYTLPTASSSTLGGVKTTSTVTSTSGYTACPIISGVPYYKDTNTTYSLSSFGVTATAAELNKLDGVTATATELNYVDGVTSNIQTQINALITRIATLESKVATLEASVGFSTNESDM